MAWWENHFLRIEEGKLYLGNKKASAIADEQGTPLFVYSKNQVLSNLHGIRRLFPSNPPFQPRICYAMKANAHPQLLKILGQEGVWIDAVSPGEVDRARELNFPGKNILFTGTSVSQKDIERIFEQDDVTVTIDACEQLDLMEEVKEQHFKHKNIKVAIRWNPGIGRGFSPKTITAGSKSPDGTPVKFGIEETKVLPAFAKASACGFIPVGLHQHLGSGWIAEDFEVIKLAVKKMVQKAQEVQKHGFTLEFLDFGGGFGPRYSREQKIFPLERYIAFITENILRAGLEIKAVALEPGKYLVADAGVLLLRVVYTKESYGNLFACVDAGTYTSVPRPALYSQARHPIINCSRCASKKNVKVTVAGNLCETADVFGQEILMPPPKRGDVLAVLVAGAYCRSMASRFNLRDIPKEILI
jgi:diaminopimelate decarboxylase